MSLLFYDFTCASLQFTSRATSAEWSRGCRGAQLPPRCVLHAEPCLETFTLPPMVKLQLVRDQGRNAAWADSSEPFWIVKFTFLSWTAQHITFPLNMPGLFSFCNCHPYKFTICHFVCAGKFDHKISKAFVACFTEDGFRPRYNIWDLQREIWLSRDISTLTWHSHPTCWMPVGSCPLLSQALDPTQSILKDEWELGLWAAWRNYKQFWGRFSISSKLKFVKQQLSWKSVYIILHSNLCYTPKFRFHTAMSSEQF